MAGHDPFVALRQRNFRIYAISLFTYGTSSMMFPAAIAWHVYNITGSVTSLLFIGLVRFVPSASMSLIAGAIVDVSDRRRISQIAQGVSLACALTFLTLTVTDSLTLPVILAIVFTISVAQSFDFPARGALLPMLVTPQSFQNAITVSGTIRQLGFVSGPSTGGMLIGFAGVEWAYAAVAVLIACSIISMAFLRPRKVEAPKRGVSVEAIREGVAFVRSRRIIVGCMALDMFAVIFGGAQALLPVYAEEVLEVGPAGYGLLAGSIDVGALIMSGLLVALPPAKRPGVLLMWAVLAFGLLTMLFGLSQWLLLSMVIYSLIGAADQVSVVMRQTTIQLNTPDELRGRVSSVNYLFIGTSNQLGWVESAGVAALFGAPFAIVSGGAGCLVVLAVVFLLIPEMRTYRAGVAIEDVQPPGTPAAAAGGQ